MLRTAVLMSCVFSITTGEFVVAGILPEVAGSLGVPIGTAGLIVTAYALGMIVGGPILTAVTAGIDRKRLMVALLVVAAIGNVLSALAPGFVPLLGARVATALVTSTFFAQAIVVAVRSAPPERSATTVARLAFGMNLAMIVGAPVGTAIGSHWGWRAAFLTVGLACLLCLVLVAVLITAPPEESRRSAVAELRVIRRRPVLMALSLTALGNIGVLMVFTYIAPLLTTVAGQPNTRLPMLLVGYGAAATLGNLLGGTLYDRNPHTSQPVLLLLLALALAAAWLTATSPLWATASIMLIGGLSFAIIPGMQARVMSAATEAPTLSMAVNASAYQLAAASAGLLGGFIADSTPGLRTLYLIASVLTIGGLFLSLTSNQTELGSRPTPAPNAVGDSVR
ncbi:MFS transporter [Nocardia sp. CDC160]|uniref:MFS transporter n=1 Tax=Nocardia sp. CDC160 TaxID=3112166 RepID=UPI002DC05F49|nr:MFS transporter [Nocardia sp. CDC160]MEC3918726.1 MFS transporter [Nocardia sp. CDC160]